MGEGGREEKDVKIVLRKLEVKQQKNIAEAPNVCRNWFWAMRESERANAYKQMNNPSQWKQQSERDRKENGDSYKTRIDK